jgi:hypothetical protein
MAETILIMNKIGFTEANSRKTDIPQYEQTIEKILQRSDTSLQQGIQLVYDSEIISGSTQQYEPNLSKLEEEFSNLIYFEAENKFNDEDLTFREGLFSLLSEYGVTFILLFLSNLEAQVIESSVAVKTIKLLGSIRDQKTRKYRLWLLERLLNNPSKFIRNSAVIGLASINDTLAIPFLVNAFNTETSEILKGTIKKVIHQLGD